MPNIRRWTDADERILREMYAVGATDAEIGMALGWSHWTITEHRRATGCTKYRRREWTDADGAQLLNLLEDHTPWHRIAAIMGRRERFLQAKAIKQAASFRHPPGHYSLIGTAELLGVDHDVVKRWVKTGRLRATRVSWSTAAKSKMWTFVDHEDLVAFLEDEGNWHLYHPERIADLALREWTIELRGGVRFLTCVEAAPHLHMTPLAVQKAVREGRMWGVQYSGRNSSWLLRSDRLVLMRARPHTPKPPFTPDDLAIIRRYWGMRPATWIARRLGRDRATGLANAAARLGLPRLGRGYWKRARAKGGKSYG